jgi:hypothetical protein
MLPAGAAELLEFKPLRSLLLVLVRRVIAVLTFPALQHDVFSRHSSTLLAAKNTKNAKR